MPQNILYIFSDFDKINLLLKKKSYEVSVHCVIIYLYILIGYAKYVQPPALSNMSSSPQVSPTGSVIWQQGWGEQQHHSLAAKFPGPWGPPGPECLTGARSWCTGMDYSRANPPGPNPDVWGGRRG